MLIGRAQKLRIAKLRLTHDTNHLKVNMESANDAHHTAITEVATYILSAGCAAYGMIREKLLEKSTIDPLDYLEFGAEFMCYILHLFDRNLSGVTDGDTRSLLIDDLCVATCREHYKLLEKGGYEASQEQFHEVLRKLYTKRQIEYGSFERDWPEQVAVHFGENVCEELEIPEDKRDRLVQFCADLAPVMFDELSPNLFKLVRVSAD